MKYISSQKLKELKKELEELKEKRKEISQKMYDAQDRGVLMGWSMYAEATVRLAPPLVISPEEVDRGLSVLREALAAVSQ